jgi:hypothetical protein
LVLKFLLKLQADQFVTETDFLYGDLEEELWMELSDGFIDYIEELQTNGNFFLIPMQQGTRAQDITETSHCLEL